MKNWKSKIILTFLIAASTAACKKDKIEYLDQPASVKYLFLGHTRMEANPEVIPEVNSINYSDYEVLMLGGDLANLTTEADSVIQHIDNIFDIANPNTLWTPGNHDYQQPGMISLYTNRPLHYAYYKNKITYLVLDTQEDNCNISGSQLNLLNAVTDTISKSSHLIVLTHKLIWMYGNTFLEPISNQTSNGSLGSNNWEINPNNFYQDVYWKLLDVQNSGTQVICIAGDIGLFTTEFEHQFDSGIQLLASGMHYNNQINKALVFNHVIETGGLTWEFIPLGEL